MAFLMATACLLATFYSRACLLAAFAGVFTSCYALATASRRKNLAHIPLVCYVSIFPAQLAKSAQDTSPCQIHSKKRTLCVKFTENAKTTAKIQGFAKRREFFVKKKLKA